MDTAVTVEAVSPGAADGAAALDRAFGWFREVEAKCSRFDPGSELRRLCERPREPVAVTPLLWGALRLAVEVARQSGGAFDPTVGRRMEMRGFDRDYRSGRRIPTGIDPEAGASWRDVSLDGRGRTVTLRRPLLLDLGGVAKGLAVDLALHELDGFAGAAVDAGGDVAVRGVNARGTAWRIGIRHPREPGELCTCLELAGGAVCTSGDYERRAHCDGGGHHVDPRNGAPAADVVSCTVVAPEASLADALSTAATILGAAAGSDWLHRHGVEGLLFTAALERFTTPGFGGLEQCG